MGALAGRPKPSSPPAEPWRRGWLRGRAPAGLPALCPLPLVLARALLVGSCLQPPSCLASSSLGTHNSPRGVRFWGSTFESGENHPHGLFVGLIWYKLLQDPAHGPGWEEPRPPPSASFPRPMEVTSFVPPRHLTWLCGHTSSATFNALPFIEVICVCLSPSLELVVFHCLVRWPKRLAWKERKRNVSESDGIRTAARGAGELGAALRCARLQTPGTPARVRRRQPCSERLFQKRWDPEPGLVA